MKKKKLTDFEYSQKRIHAVFISRRWLSNGRTVAATTAHLKHFYGYPDKMIRQAINKARVELGLKSWWAFWD